MIAYLKDFQDVCSRYGVKLEDANQYMKDGVRLRQVINVIDELDLGDYDEVHAFGEIYESILRESEIFLRKLIFRKRPLPEYQRYSAN